MAPSHAEERPGTGPLPRQARDPEHDLDFDFPLGSPLLLQAEDLLASRPVRLQVLCQPSRHLQPALLDPSVTLVHFARSVDAPRTARSGGGEGPASGSAKAATMSARDVDWSFLTGRT